MRELNMEDVEQVSGGTPTEAVALWTTAIGLVALAGIGTLGVATAFAAAPVVTVGALALSAVGGYQFSQPRAQSPLAAITKSQTANHRGRERLLPLTNHQEVIMEITGNVVHGAIKLTALRLLAMGLCATALWLTQPYTAVTTEQAFFCFILGIFLLTLAALLFTYSILKSFPCEIATLSPKLKLPSSLVKGGYDSSTEPLEYWLWITDKKKKILVGTAKRQFKISNLGLPEEHWQRLALALPAQKQLPTPKALKSIKLILVCYAALLISCHFLLRGPSDFVFFNLLMRGGYNAAVATEGEFYRALSYAWLHVNSTHLWANLLSLALLTEILGQSFSNKTLGVVLIFSAVLSGVLGSFGREFSIIIGASGAIMGLFGFLFAAQYKRDKRLSPLAREPRQKLLYLILCLEFFLSLRYPWYGGFVHIVGIGAGYATYCLFETGNKRRWHDRTERAILACGLVLFLSWAIHTIGYLKIHFRSCSPLQPYPICLMRAKTTYAQLESAPSSYYQPTVFLIGQSHEQTIG